MSAQQARERKKHYVSELEQTVAEQGATINHLREELKDVTSSNATLRRLLMTVSGSSAGASTSVTPAAACSTSPSQPNGVFDSSPLIIDCGPHNQPFPHSQNDGQQHSGQIASHPAGGTVLCGNAPSATLQHNQAKVVAGKELQLGGGHGVTDVQRQHALCQTGVASGFQSQDVDYH